MLCTEESEAQTRTRVRLGRTIPQHAVRSLPSPLGDVGRRQVVVDRQDLEPSTLPPLWLEARLEAELLDGLELATNKNLSCGH